MKDKAIFAAEVLVVLVVIGLVQSKFMNVPAVGQLLPGYTPRT